MLGKSYLMEKRNYAKAIELLEEAASMIPTDVDIRLMLAQAYAEAERKSDALAVARSVLDWSQDNEERAKSAEDIIASLEAQDADSPID